MREIEFRGKERRTGKWRTGDLLHTEPNDDMVIITPNYLSPYNYRVIPETVGQYTGLKDKNGVKIFEGDYLGHRLNVVEWLNGCFCINGDRPLSWFNKDCRVSGNIHDTPELLEVSQ